ncbi:hypothetical protein GM1_025_00240 [Gordonia malaquae NBRC 108250]|uniref:HipA N-terminal subdomain 1 domain-containing protein n=1 Tax=Gordonia malaquae NBRC 108250 TaxID=1223542 RepID=M3UYL5_GORML|nr:HipA N-terminal domain-containing protein [Gordonia malaquae]GAC80977.1 hypothetical protein GM1_025_00240 [Gordonia malaquae NBRC 108250]
MTAAADLRAVDRADVYVGDRLTAALTRDGKGVTTLDYRDPIPTGRTGGIAWSLPGPDSPFEVGGDALPAFFAGLLPEGVRLGVALTATKTSADDHFTLLLSVGSDTVGDVRVVPEGCEPRIRPPMVTDMVTDLREVFREFTSSFESDAVAMAGVQPKVSASMWSTPTVTDRGPAILKLSPPSGFPKLVENEHFFMRMAAACGITAASTTIVEDESGVTGLLVAADARIRPPHHPALLEVARSDGDESLRSREPAEAFGLHRRRRAARCRCAPDAADDRRGV